MSKRKPLIRSILNGNRPGPGQPAPANEEATDDVRLLREISFQVEQEKLSGFLNMIRPGEHKACLRTNKDDARPPGRRKRPAPKHNKALKDAEQAALQKPMTPLRYRQVMKEHLEILPMVFNIMDKNGSG